VQGLTRLILVPGLLVSTGAFAETPVSLTLRAVGPHVNDAVVRYVARSTRPFNLSTQELSRNTPLTGRDIVGRLCGSFREAYWAEVLEANKANPPSLDKPVPDAGALAWPRCLYVELFRPGKSVTVRPKDIASEIYKRHTGSPGTSESIAKFFAVDSVDDVKALKVGQKLTISYSTLPVTVVPRGNSPQAFTDELKRLAAADGKPPFAMIVVSEPTQGEIVVSVPTLGPADESQVESSCAPFADSPIDRDAIQNAYRYAYEVIKLKGTGDIPRRAKIMVVDNGFFGANPENVGDPFEGSPFPSKFFRKSSDGQSIIAQRINVNTTDLAGEQAVVVNFIDPINYVHGLVADETSGHGTHVTGLTLGGPGFVESSDSLRDNAAPWAEITILNVGKGGKGLVPGAHDQIFKALTISEDPGYIVNMSIAYDTEVPGISAMFDTLRRRMGVRGLLVVAAGNSSQPLSWTGLLPGSLGGASAENVVTVAAHDAKSRVASFSNYDENVVDIAAPGCGISSWIGNWDQTFSLSGTSMATPFVTFAAGLLRSLIEDAEGRDLKNRLIAAADLLADEDRFKTAYGGIRVNVAKSLYWFKDYVRIGGVEFLGTVRNLPDSALRCKRSGPVRKLSDIWAVKRRKDGTGLLFLGKRNHRIESVCESQDLAMGDLSFTPTHQITSAGIQGLTDPLERTVPLGRVDEVVFRSGGGAN
jgi:subtilisin family serine protease